MLERKYSLQTPGLHTQAWLRMSVDASPWGLGGVKWDEHWRPIEYFHSPITDDDVRLLKVAVGDSAHMPVLEALAVLIAIRIWGESREVAYSIRSDAPGAIQALANLRSKNPGVNRVAAELALDIIDKQYAPLRMTHIPGVSNVFPDFLSRLLQPGAKAADVEPLSGAKQVVLPRRDLSWWRTLSREAEFIIKDAKAKA